MTPPKPKRAGRVWFDKADDRTVNAEGAPYGPILSALIREKMEKVRDNNMTFDDRVVLVVVMESAADFIDAVNEGAVIARPAPRAAGRRKR